MSALSLGCPCRPLGALFLPGRARCLVMAPGQHPVPFAGHPASPHHTSPGHADVHRAAGAREASLTIDPCTAWAVAGTCQCPCPCPLPRPPAPFCGRSVSEAGGAVILPPYHPFTSQCIDTPRKACQQGTFWGAVCSSSSALSPLPLVLLPKAAVLPSPCRLAPPAAPPDHRVLASPGRNPPTEA